MAKAETSDSADQEIDSDYNSGPCSEEVETPRKINAGKKISNYEIQRMKRIAENRSRMEALGLKKMVNSFASSLPKQAKKTSSRKGKGKRKVEDDDDEYRPSGGEEELDSSTDEDEKDGYDDEEIALAKTRKKVKNKTKNPKTPVSSQEPLIGLDFADDDEALMQAIALSIQDPAGFIDVNGVASQGSSTHPIGRSQNAREENSLVQEDMGKRKRKKPIKSQVQMTEDELIILFFQFDEAGKGNMSLRDLQKVAAAHDFTWSEKEIADMILCFDSDGDGKLSLEDFQKIVGRCNMIQESETPLVDA